VCNTPGVLDETTADLAFLLIVAASRLASTAEADLRSGRWHGWGINQYLGRDVHGATLGLVGFGRIGQAVARRAAGFGMRVLYHNRKRDPEAERSVGAEYRSKPELLREADFVVLAIPLTAESRHLIGAAELALMKPTAFLVNVARGPVVDEGALVEALRAKRLAGAGLDVFEDEPKVHPGLLGLENVALTPHIGSASGATRLRMATRAVENCVAALEGQRPPNLVNPEAWRSP
jgi:lactate dehydrogenase-like 2-hydroxyacid dehydrogenase